MKTTHTCRLLSRPVKARGSPHEQGRRRYTSSSKYQYTPSHGPRPGPAQQKPVGLLMGEMDVVILVVGIHYISWGATRAGPLKHVGRLIGRMVRSMKNPRLMGHGPARPIKFLDHGPRPDPVYQIIISWAATGHSHHFFRARATARPGPSIFSNFDGPARLSPLH